MRIYIATALLAPTALFGASYFTSFENNGVPMDNWYTGLSSIYLSNGWAEPGAVTVNGFQGTFLNGHASSGLQSAPCGEVTATSNTRYASRSWFASGTKKGLVSLRVRLHGTGDANPVMPGRGFGIEVNNWRLFICNVGGQLQLWRNNAKTATQGQVPGSGTFNFSQWYTLGLGLDVSSTVPNAAMFYMLVNGVVVATESFTALGSDTLGLFGRMMNRNVSGTGVMGSANFDDFYMSDQIVPEPATMLPLIAGSIAMLASRRLSRKQIES